MSDPNYEQNPFNKGNDLVENPEQRCPLLLLLDTSGSMGGDPIRQLNEGLQVLRDELFADTLAAKRCEVAIVTFGPVRTECDFTSMSNFIAPTLSAGGDTPMGGAIEYGLTLLQARKEAYKAAGVPSYRPWVFLITDGAPTDAITKAKAAIAEGENRKSFMFFAVAVEGANIEALKNLSVREPLKLKGLRFRDLFQWLSSSMASVSRSNPGDEVPLSNPATPQGWATAG